MAVVAAVVAAVVVAVLVNVAGSVIVIVAVIAPTIQRQLPVPRVLVEASVDAGPVAFMPRRTPSLPEPDPPPKHQEHDRRDVWT